MADEKFDPIKEFTGIRDTLSKALEQSVKGMIGVGNVQLDILETPENLIIRTSPIDGAKPDTLEVSVENGILRIIGQTEADNDHPENAAYLSRERKFGIFSRIVRLPRPVDSEAAQAKFKNGVLTITFPKVVSSEA